MGIQVRTINEARFGTRITLFSAGTVDISDEGTFEVENEQIAKDVEDTYDDFLIVGGEKEKETEKLGEELKKKSEQNELGKGDENDIGLSEDEKNELLQSLSTQPMPELKKLAQPFPNDEWKGLNKLQLIDYLKSKL